MLELAHITYGARVYPVEPNATLPLPAEFDFEHPEDCARLIFAIMSNACGGHRLKECRARILRAERIANLVCNGAHVYYAEPNRPKITWQEAIARDERAEIYQLGSVVTDQYGDGWQRAEWTPA